MKSNKVLLGLFVGLLTLAGGAVNAQNFYEIGPDNIGGQVSSIVIDKSDASGVTLYAGATNGGLFVKSSSIATLRNLYQNLGKNQDLGNDTNIWHRVPYYTANGLEMSLPISCMVQGSTEHGDNSIYIGTGSSVFSQGTTYYSAMSRKGMGIFRYNATNNSFNVLPGTEDIEAVNDIDYIYRDGKTYLFAATSSGLRRVVLENGAIVNDTLFFPGNVRDIQIIRSRRTGYFSVAGNVYRIGDLTRAHLTNPVNVSATNTAFGGSNDAILFAVAPSNNNYLYAMVINAAGLLSAVYLTTNEQTWVRLSSETVAPFYYDGRTCGAIAVDPTNPRHVIMGGNSVWAGEGYSDNGYFFWSQASSSENSLNGGNYMSQVFSSYSFVHSGINQIFPVDNGDGTVNYYFATNGGVFTSNSNLYPFYNISRGLNNLQITGIAVAADGTIISGAMGNACPLIETVNDHNVSDVEGYRNSNVSWYDNGSRVINHNANIVWYGNGNQTAASSFQQVMPQSRRTIFTSSSNMGRAYADYLDFTNTNTWTADTSFTSNSNKGSYGMTTMYLWETDHDTYFNSNVKMGVDTLGYVQRLVNGVWDTVWVNDPANGDARGSKFQVLAGDTLTFFSRGHADYPFKYVPQTNFLAKDSITVKNPIQSRMVTVGALNKVSSAVFYTWQPSDFTRVWDANEMIAHPDKCIVWSPVFIITRSADSLYLRNAVVSNDGRYVYCSAYVPEGNSNLNKSMLFRISGFENIDFNMSNVRVRDSLSFENPHHLLHVDTIRVNNSIWFDRPISSIAVDPREGEDRIVLTFEHYDDTYGNVAILENASTTTGNPTFVPITVGDELLNHLPVYSAIVEKTHGDIYAGTADGLYIRNHADGSWAIDSALHGIPVTAMCQQVKNYPVRRNLTHTGITANKYVFAKTKWPGAIYYGTYGRGIFMDMSYVTDFSNDIADEADYLDIPTVLSNGANTLSLYPNPVCGDAHLTLNAETAGNAIINIYDLNGRRVVSRNLGHVAEGEHSFTISTEGMAKGMYLINVVISGQTAAAKMIVR